MLNSFKNYVNYIPKSAKALVKQLNSLQKAIKRSKRSKPKRVFSGFDEQKSSFATLELSSQLELVFKFIDANGDGKISQVELSEFLLCLGHDKSKAKDEAQGMFKYMDVNGDGFVDLHEYMDAVMMGSSDDDDEKHGQYDHCLDGFEDDLIDAFHVFDADKNGLISARELQPVLKRLGFANCSLKECNRMIRGVDMDGDGFVNFEEFKLMMMGYAR